jgi:hypothetical protein
MPDIDLSIPADLATADQAAEPTEQHDRTPENTPLPGGGRWAWDTAAGAWVSLDPQPE